MSFTSPITGIGQTRTISIASNLHVGTYVHNTTFTISLCSLYCNVFIFNSVYIIFPIDLVIVVTISLSLLMSLSLWIALVHWHLPGNVFLFRTAFLLHKCLKCPTVFLWRSLLPPHTCAPPAHHLSYSPFHNWVTLANICISVALHFFVRHCKQTYYTYYRY